MKKVHIIIGLLIAALTVGCDTNGTMLTIPEGDVQGSAKVVVEVAQVGILAKASAFQLEELVIRLEAADEEVIEERYTLTGHGGTTVDVEFSDLASFKNWKVSVWSLDAEGVVVHSGASSFYVEPNSTTDVELNLSSSYSIVEAAFASFPDSVTSIALYVDGEKKDVVTDSKETTLSFDYLTVSEEHEITIVAEGVLWGEKMDLYSGTTVIIPKAGESKGYELTVEWVGTEEPPKGNSVLDISLGTVGRSVIETVFEKHEVKYSTEKKNKK